MPLLCPARPIAWIGMENGVKLFVKKDCKFYFNALAFLSDVFFEIHIKVCTVKS